MHAGNVRVREGETIHGALESVCEREKLYTGHLSPCARGRNYTVHGALEFARRLQKTNPIVQIH